MFTSVAEARGFLEDAGLGDLAERVVPLLQPCLMLVPAETDRLGGTRTGGLPDLPSDLPWPVRLKPADSEAIVRLGGTAHAAGLDQHASREQPYEFIAQIDLSDARNFALADHLPPEGRLLFFYDSALGPWRDGVESARVIWDRAPLGALTPHPLPTALAELIAEDRAAHDRQQADPMAMASQYSAAQLEIFSQALESGETLEDFFRKIVQNMEFIRQYAHPSQPMRIAQGVQWPDRQTVHAQHVPALRALDDDDALNDSYMDLSRGSGATSGAQQLLVGIPIPEQDDPLYAGPVMVDPALAELLDADRETGWPMVEERAKEWRLLLQIELASLRQAKYVEGFVYFIIHKNDLASRDFTRTLAIYQQT
jgi:hypothetical protein